MKYVCVVYDGVICYVMVMFGDDICFRLVDGCVLYEIEVVWLLLV